MRLLDGITDSMDMGLGEIQTSGVDDGQGGLVCCSSWGRKDLDTTERLNCTELSFFGWQYCVFCHSDVSGGQWVPWDHDYG